MAGHKTEMARHEPSISNPGLPVTFFIGDEPDVDGLKNLDPGQVLQHCRRGEFAWVVQTYSRLRAFGFPVKLANVPPQEGLVIFHAKQKRLLAQAVNRSDNLIFVGIRADNSAPLLADFEIVQNGYFADDIRRFQVTFWPQPDIQPRDPGRGARVERVAYMGLIENLAPEFRGDAWIEGVSRLGMEWVPQMVRYREMKDPAQVDWEDYRGIDVLLAIRPQEKALAFAKPASKLINAWRAGVPILVGPEYPYREIRESKDDFIEITDVPTAIEALRRLKNDPDLYRRMVANGYRRALEFSESKITQRWVELLFETIPTKVADEGLHWTRLLPLGLRLPVRRALRWIRRERSR